MRSVQIYVENIRLDLFQDENISVTSSVQNISDITTVFSDFSQTFTIPCTKTNNYVFEHYYNNDVDNTIDHQVRREARIEIDHIPFRYGKIQIEKASIKDGFASDYSVTFFGAITSLKDVILDDKLKDLDYSSLDHSYSGTEISTRITTDPASTDYDVKYPLITSGRVWQYGDSSANDISISGGAISYDELFPAVRVSKILDAIATKYSVTFSGSWLSTDNFQKLFMWFKNKEQFTYYSQPKALRFAIGGTSTNAIYESEVRVNYVVPSSLVVPPYDTCNSFIQHVTEVTISTGSSIDYLLDVYKNGQYLISIPGNGADTFTIATDFNNPQLANTYYFQLRSTSAMTFSCTIDYSYQYTLVNTGVGSTQFTYSESVTSASSFTTVVNTNLSSLAPDMKITDFLKGLFNMFNLTCYGTSATEFQIEPLETYYDKGNTYNITKYVTTDLVDVARPKLYNNISFEWSQSNSFMNREFFDLFGREYGSLKAAFGYDGGDFAISLPFETLLHSKFSSSGLHVGYCLGTEPEYKQYVPKPVMLYEYDYSTGQSFYFDNGSTVNNLTTYVPFGQDAFIGLNDFTLKWGSEYSSMTWQVETETLYKTYYENYLQNLFNPKTRMVSVKAILPTSILTDINLNDSLIIRDKKYIINDMNTNLTNGEVEFSLLSSWREDVDFSTTYNISNISHVLSYEFNIPTDTTVTIGACLEASFTTVSDTTPTGDQIVTFTCTSNGTAAVRYNTFPLTVVRDGVTLTFSFLVLRMIFLQLLITEFSNPYLSRLAAVLYVRHQMLPFFFHGLSVSPLLLYGLHPKFPLSNP